jgi:hypothetical protein
MRLLEIEDAGLRDLSTPHELQNANSDILSVVSGIPAHIRLFPHNLSSPRVTKPDGSTLGQLPFQNIYSTMAITLDRRRSHREYPSNSAASSSQPILLLHLHPVIANTINIIFIRTFHTTNQ